MSTRSGRRRGRVHRVLAVDRLAHDLEVVLGLDEHPQARADEVLVVGDEHADAHAGTAARGSRAWTPKPGTAPVLRSPPHAARRSAIPRSPVPVPTTAAGAGRRARGGPVGDVDVQAPVARDRDRTAVGAAWRAAFVSASCTTE